MNESMTIGMDLGDKKHDICILDREGQIIRQLKIGNNQKELDAFYKDLEPAVVVMEVGTHSRWVSRMLKECGHEVLVGNAHKLRAIWDSSNKNDQRDAEMLARIGRFDRALLHPIEHRGDKAHADLAVIKGRDILVQTRTKLISYMRSTVKSFGYRLPNCSPESFHRQVQADLPTELYPALIGTLEVIAALNEQIKNYDQQIRNLCDQVYPETHRLRQVTGVGPVTAMAYVLTLENPERFKKSRQVGAFLGLTRKIDQSGATDRALPISKAGDAYLRRLLVGASHYILGPFGPPCRLREHGERIAAGGGKSAKKRAVVAVARKLAVLLHYLWKSDDVYDPMYKEGVKAGTPALTAPLDREKEEPTPVDHSCARVPCSS